MENAASPELLGPAIYRIIKKEKPKLRYRVGSTMEKFSVCIIHSLAIKKETLCETGLLEYHRRPLPIPQHLLT